MGGMAERKLSLRAIEEAGFGEALPVEVFRHSFERAPGQKVIVFTMRAETREAMAAEQMRTIAEVLGNLAHPAQCAFIVVPKGLHLEIYEVEEENHGEEEGEPDPEPIH